MKEKINFHNQLEKIFEQLKNSEEYKNYQKAKKIMKNDQNIAKLKAEQVEVIRLLKQKNKIDNKSIKELLAQRVIELESELSKNEAMRYVQQYEKQLKLVLDYLKLKIREEFNE